MTAPIDHKSAALEARPGDLPDEVHYRSLSLMAVATIVLGLFSALALATPNLWFLPFLTVGLALATLWILAANPDKIGRRGVILGLLLATFFGVFGPTRYFSHQWYLFHKAQQVTDTWLDLVKDGRFLEAYQLHLRAGDRIRSDPAKEKVELDPETEGNQEAFFAVEPLSYVAVAKDDLDVQYAGRGVLVHKGGIVDTVVLYYQLTFTENNQQKAFPIQIALERYLDRSTGNYFWRVAKCGFKKT